MDRRGSTYSRRTRWAMNCFCATQSKDAAERAFSPESPSARTSENYRYAKFVRKMMDRPACRIYSKQAISRRRDGDEADRTGGDLYGGAHVPGGRGVREDRERNERCGQPNGDGRSRSDERVQQYGYPPGQGGQNDELYGGRGADTVDGGTGNDTLRGGPGDDDMHAADGQDDDIYCGPGEWTWRRQGILRPRRR